MLKVSRVGVGLGIRKVGGGALGLGGREITVSVCVVHTETRGVIFEGGRPVGFSPRCTVDEISGSKVHDRVFQVAEIPGIDSWQEKGDETTRLYL